METRVLLCQQLFLVGLGKSIKRERGRERDRERQEIEERHLEKPKQAALFDCSSATPAHWQLLLFRLSLSCGRGAEWGVVGKEEEEAERFGSELGGSAGLGIMAPEGLA